MGLIRYSYECMQGRARDWPIPNVTHSWPMQVMEASSRIITLPDDLSSIQPKARGRIRFGREYAEYKELKYHG